MTISPDMLTAVTLREQSRRSAFRAHVYRLLGWRDAATWADRNARELDRQATFALAADAVREATVTP